VFVLILTFDVFVVVVVVADSNGPILRKYAMTLSLCKFATSGGSNSVKSLPKLSGKFILIL
jgi:hypothetical protein